MFKHCLIVFLVSMVDVYKRQAPGGVHGVLAAGQGIPPVPGLPEAQGGGVP